MTNTQLIADAAIRFGIYTLEEVQGMIDIGVSLPLHTYNGWKARGYQVKEGEKGIETRLWKRRGKTEEDESSEERGFYLAKSFLFTEEQVEPIEENEYEGIN